MFTVLKKLLHSTFSPPDNIIKVWRLYPFAEEALAPLMSFYCAHTPVHMTMLKTNLCVAFQDHATATYNIVIYNLKDRSKFGWSWYLLSNIDTAI